MESFAYPEEHTCTVVSALIMSSTGVLPQFQALATFRVSRSFVFETSSVSLRRFQRLGIVYNR
jgi:hypothetical protein